MSGRASFSLEDVNTCSMRAAMPHFFPEFFNDKDTPKSMEWLARMGERPGIEAAPAMSHPPPTHRHPHNQSEKGT